MQTMLRKQTDQLVRGEEFCRKQISLFANAVLGSTILREVMKSMKKQDEWLDDIQKRYGAAKDEKATTDLA
eukprot:3393647-Rhodomonas_salina.1